MDEGVKASITRQTMQMSPKATNLESQFSISKKDSKKYADLDKNNKSKLQNAVGKNQQSNKKGLEQNS